MSTVLVLSAKRMMEYLPPYWHEYAEMQQILKNEGAEIDELDDESEFILTDAFLYTMTERRIEEWEEWLGLPPTGTLEDRRLAILNYFAVISKLTRESIQVLVSQLYQGARAIVRFKDSTIKITIKPLPEHDTEEIEFQILIDRLNPRKPTHIPLFVDRYISTWGEVNQGFSSWGNMKNRRTDWQAVYDFILE